jgi:hypothetical protein
MPMTVHDDATAAREAVSALERAVQALAGHYGDGVDARRLKSDVERVAQDLELLCGQDSPPVPPVAPPPMTIIDDRVYSQDFWMDAEDEGLGGGR